MSLPLEERYKSAGIRDQDKTHQSAGTRFFWEKKLNSC